VVSPPGLGSAIRDLSAFTGRDEDSRQRRVAACTNITLMLHENVTNVPTSFKTLISARTHRPATSTERVSDRVYASVDYLCPTDVLTPDTVTYPSAEDVAFFLDDEPTCCTCETDKVALARHVFSIPARHNPSSPGRPAIDQYGNASPSYPSRLVWHTTHSATLLHEPKIAVIRKAHALNLDGVPLAYHD